jgi:F-type H+-transporting ATPase subunit delta
MTHSAVASRYANALADVIPRAPDGSNAAAVLAELRAFEEALHVSRELHEALTSPAVAPSRKRAVVGRLADVLKLSRITRNFLFVLVDKRRIALLPAILHSFELIADERMGLARAEVASARPLNDAQRQSVIAQLERISGRRISARYNVDEALLGGVVARIGSTVYDGSVRGQLETLGRQLSTES